GDQESPGRQDQAEPPAGGTSERSLPPASQQVLDALRDSEENLERARARARAARENRQVEQDW
ncbi:MAG: hypothetical protein K8H88_26810, partial [Sandaracinaceae bacterium]|nr:hypothetical protein [Sandaracinaceae bacterium]